MSLKNLGGSLKAGVQGAKKKHSENIPNTKRGMPLEDIKDRPHGNTRSLNDEHVAELVESIAAVGLIQPLAVDKAGHLLAGGHRRQALTVLKEEQAERYAELFPSGIPVRVFEFDADEDLEQAIIIEATENEKRRDYTPKEVRELADRLTAAGYEDKPGNQKGHTKKLTPALMTIVGKSRRTIKGYLAKEESTLKTPPLETARSRAQKVLQNLMEHPSLKGRGWKQNHREYLQAVMDDLEFVGESSESFSSESAILNDE